jgi:co-chaperonin GroES (HSP10)
MDLRPPGDRILVLPDEAPPVSDVIHMPDIAKKNVEMSGTVVALGNGSLKYAEMKRKIVRDAREIIAQTAETFRCENSAFMTMLNDELGRWGAIRPVEYDVQVGDRVLFTWDVGVKMTFDGQEYIVLKEDDIVGVFTEEDAA